MKKFILVLGVFAAVALTSCSKEKDCECTTSIENLADQLVDKTIDDGECGDMNMETTTMGVTATTKCIEK